MIQTVYDLGNSKNPFLVRLAGFVYAYFWGLVVASLFLGFELLVLQGFAALGISGAGLVLIAILAAAVFLLFSYLWVAKLLAQKISHVVALATLFVVVILVVICGSIDLSPPHSPPRHVSLAF